MVNLQYTENEPHLCWDKPNPTNSEFYQHINESEYRAFRFLLYKDVITIPNKCVKCGSNANPSSLKKVRCINRKCRHDRGYLKDTFFGNSRLRFDVVLEIIFLFSKNLTHTQMTKAMAGRVSKNTLTDYINHISQLIAESFEESEAGYQIGGEGVIVEIDESKFAKRKDNRGRRVKAGWVFGGIERTADRRVFAIPVKDRTSKTLHAAIRKYIAPGSLIISDGWKSYHNISTVLGFEHIVVNHTLGFVDPDGNHTNSIEASWNGMKTSVPRKGRSDSKKLSRSLWVYAWRKQVGILDTAFESLLKLIAEARYIV